MRTYTRISTAVLASGILACPLSAWTQDTGVQPVVQVGIRTLNADGSRGRDAGITRVVKPGEKASGYLHAGRIEDPDGQLCSMRAADTTGRELNALDRRGLDAALYVWKVTTTSVVLEAGRQTIDLEWARFDRASTTATVSRKSRLTLADGQTHALDLVHGTAAAPCLTPAVILEVTALTQEAPALADTVLRYDMWLVRHDGSGRKETRHVVLSGLQGRAPAFDFPPMFAPVPRLQDDQYDFRVATRISGTVRGRLTQEGQVSLELETHRSNRLERIPATALTLPPRSAGGRKMLTGALGEAIEIQLPPAAGSSSSPASERDLREVRERASAVNRLEAPPRGMPPADEPVLIRNGRLTVNYPAFFEGERLSVIVQVRKADAGSEQPALR